MDKIIIILAILSIILLSGCHEPSENEQYYYRGVKAEHEMQYDVAIEHYAKALTFNRQDPHSWYAKGRCHLLLAVHSYFMEEPGNLREVRIQGNLTKADDCFRRAAQWGYPATASSDTLRVKLNDFFSNSPQE